MKYTIQFECMNKECNTVVLGTHRQDGIKCPRCDGPVLPKSFQPIKKVSEDAYYVRGKIIEGCHEHCFDLTPEQVDTVLEIYKGKISGLSPVALIQELTSMGIGKRNA